MNTISFTLGNDKNKEVDFNRKTVTFTLQLFKIETIKWGFKNLNVIHIVLVVEIELLQQKFIVI